MGTLRKLRLVVIILMQGANLRKRKLRPQFYWKFFAELQKSFKDEFSGLF